MKRTLLTFCISASVFAQAPSITQGPIVGNITRSSATFIWTTDVPASTLIKWGYGGTTGKNSAPLAMYDDLTRIHYWYIGGMTGGTAISYKVCSTANSTETCSSTGTFTTATQASPPADPTPPNPVDTPTVPTGAIHTVGADCNDPTTGLVAMWAAAARGDIVEIDPAITAQCAGTYIFPAKADGPPYILTRVKDATANLGTRRVSAADKSNMARFIHNGPDVSMYGTLDPTPDNCMAGSYHWRQGQANAWAMYRCNNVNPQSITAITASGNLRLTVPGHGLSNLHMGYVSGVTGPGAGTVNGALYINVIDANTIEVHDYIGNGVRTATGAASGGTIYINQYQLVSVTEGATPPGTCTAKTFWHKQASSGAEDEYHRTWYCHETNNLIPYDMNVNFSPGTYPRIDLVTNKANYLIFDGLSFEPINLPGDAQQTQYMYQAANQAYGTMVWFFIGQSIDNHHIYWDQILASCPDPSPSGVMVRCHGFSTTFDGAHISMKRSDLEGFQVYHAGADLDDGSAIVLTVFNGGPTEIVNNYISCAGICIYYPDEIGAVTAAKDLTLKQNTIESPDKYFDQSGSWLGNGLYWSSRHRFETKRLTRGLIDGNIFKNGWVFTNNAAAICLCTRGGQAGPQISDISDGAGGSGNIVTTYLPGPTSNPGWTLGDVQVGDLMYFSAVNGTCAAATQFWTVGSVIDYHKITLTGLNCQATSGNISRVGAATNNVQDVLVSNNTFLNSPTDTYLMGHDQGPPPRQLIGPAMQRIKYSNNLSIGLDGGRVGLGAFSANPAVAPSGNHLVVLNGMEDLQIVHETVSSRTRGSFMDDTLSTGGPSSGLKVQNNIFTTVGGASITNDGSGQTPVQALNNVFIGLTPAYAATNNVVINPGGAVSGYPSRTWFFNSASGTFPWNDPAHGDYTLTSKYRSSDICISAPGDCTTDGKSAGVDLGALEVAQAVDTACTFSVSPTFATVPAVGGTVTFEIAASGPTCSWTAKSNVPWLKVVEGATGVGSGSARFSGDANEGSLRSASVTVAGRSISVQQVGYESGRASGLSGVSAVRGRSRVE